MKESCPLKGKFSPTIILGACVIGVTLFGVYYFMKKDKKSLLPVSFV